MSPTHLTQPPFDRILGDAFPSLLRNTPCPRITLVGGGHGLSAVLHVLKPLPFYLTAIVAVSDDGGSSGRLRDTFHMAPPGDLRRCLLALSSAPDALTALFEYRFSVESDAGFADHVVGNVALAALFEQCGGDFPAAVAALSEILQVRGTVLPATATPTRLRARLRNGAFISGETAIGKGAGGVGIDRVFLDPPNVSATPGVLEALRDADLVLIGPGSLYTSVLPPLLTPGVAETLRERTGRTIYLCNPCVEPGATDGFRASDHVRVLLDHLGANTIRKAVLNEVRLSPLPLVGNLVESDGDTLSEYGLPWVYGDMTALLSEI